MQEDPVGIDLGHRRENVQDSVNVPRAARHRDDPVFARAIRFFPGRVKVDDECGEPFGGQVADHRLLQGLIRRQIEPRTAADVDDGRKRTGAFRFDQSAGYCFAVVCVHRIDRNRDYVRITAAHRRRLVGRLRGGERRVTPRVAGCHRDQRDSSQRLAQHRTLLRQGLS